MESTDQPAELRVYDVEQPNGTTASVKLTAEQAKAAGITGKGREVRKRSDQVYAERHADDEVQADVETAESKTLTAQNKARSVGSTGNKSA